MQEVVLRLVLEVAAEGGYCVFSEDWPQIITQGETVEECLYMAKDLAELLQKVTKEHDIPIPARYRNSPPSEWRFEVQRIDPAREYD